MPVMVWVGFVVFVVVFVSVAFAFWVRKRRRRPVAAQVLKTAAIAAAHNVLLPNGMGGEIHVEHLLLTAQGIVVVDVKEFAGRIFGSDLMDEWTVIGTGGRFTFPNPEISLYDRVAAVRRLVRDDVPVHGHVLFTEAAEFSGGRPGAVILADEFVERYHKPAKADLDAMRDALLQPWERIREVSQGA